MLRTDQDLEEDLPAVNAVTEVTVRGTEIATTAQISVIMIGIGNTDQREVQKEAAESIIGIENE